MGVAVIMDRPRAPVVPGAETTSDIRIRNTGPVVDQFELDIVGEAATWAHVEPSAVNLMPGEESTATIVFSPPRSPQLAQGPVPYALRVMSREDTGGSSIQEAVIDVAPFSQTGGELLPRTSTGSRRGRHELVLDNLGNHPELVTVTAGDPDLKLDFRLDPANPTLEPGTATFVKLTAKPKKTYLRGPNTTIPFTVVAQPASGEPVVVSGAMLQTAILPAWILKALALAVAAAVALVVLWLVVLKPTVESTARNVAEDNTQKLANAITAATQQAAQAQKDAADAKKTAEQSSGTGGKNGGKNGATNGDTNQSDSQQTATGTLDPGQATDFRIVTDVPSAGGFVSKTFTPAKKTTLWISDLVLQNPAGDTGTLRIQRGSDVLMVFGLENFRDLDYHFIQPALFTADQPVVVSVDCANTVGNCSASVYFSGRSITTPTKKKG
jgi:hypothetical protein